MPARKHPAAKKAAARKPKAASKPKTARKPTRKPKAARTDTPQFFRLKDSGGIAATIYPSESEKQSFSANRAASRIH